MKTRSFETCTTSAFFGVDLLVVSDPSLRLKTTPDALHFIDEESPDVRILRVEQNGRLCFWL